MKKINENRSKEYFEKNQIVKEFIDKVNLEITEYNNRYSLSINELTIDVGTRYVRIWQGNTCWGFISRVNGVLKGAPIKKGDLLKAASWKAPARISRGNIIEGTAEYGIYGPSYLI